MHKPWIFWLFGFYANKALCTNTEKNQAFGFRWFFQTKKKAAVPLSALFLLDYECFPVGHDHQHPAPDVNGCGLAGVAFLRRVKLCGCGLGFFLFEFQRLAVGRFRPAGVVLQNGFQPVGGDSV